MPPTIEKFDVVTPLVAVTLTVVPEAALVRINGVLPEASRTLDAVRLITRVVVLRVASKPVKLSVPPPRFTFEKSAPKPRELGAKSPTVFTARMPALIVVEPV